MHILALYLTNSQLPLLIYHCDINMQPGSFVAPDHLLNEELLNISQLQEYRQSGNMLLFHLLAEN